MLTSKVNVVEGPLAGLCTGAGLAMETAGAPTSWKSAVVFDATVFAGVEDGENE